MNAERIVEAFKKVPDCTIVVLGDYCLDKYLYSDPAEDDISVESGKPAWQIYEKKMAAGVAGTITNNLCALGAKVICVGFAGDDGEGFELMQQLEKLGADTEHMILTKELVTATYLKTMRKTESGWAEDLRFDFRNRQSPSEELADALIAEFETAVKRADGVIISDQFYERNSGVVGDYMREKINALAAELEIPFLVDSRAFAAEFKNAYVKCNNYELMKYCGVAGDPEKREDILAGGEQMKKLTGRDVFITRNKDGIMIFSDPLGEVPAYPIEPPFDVTGCGDASNAGIILGLTVGLTPTEAAVIACAVSSVTIQQLGTTGTSTPEQAMERVRAICAMMNEG